MQSDCLGVNTVAPFTDWDLQLCYQGSFVLLSGVPCGLRVLSSAVFYVIIDKCWQLLWMESRGSVFQCTIPATSACSSFIYAPTFPSSRSPSHLTSTMSIQPSVPNILHFQDTIGYPGLPFQYYGRGSPNSHVPHSSFLKMTHPSLENKTLLYYLARPGLFNGLTNHCGILLCKFPPIFLHLHSSMSYGEPWSPHLSIGN